MKVFFLIPDLTSGGAEKVFATLLKLWDQEGCPVELVVLRREGPYFALLPNSLVVHVLGCRRLLSAIGKLISLLRREKPDLVFSTQAHVNAALGWIRFLFPKMQFMGRETSIPSQTKLFRSGRKMRLAVYRHGYRQLDFLVCPSHVVARELEQLYRIASDRVRVIPNPLDTKGLQKSAYRDLPGAVKDFFQESPVGTVFVTAVGRLEAVKGFDLLIRAAEKTPENYRFVVIGDGSLKRSLLLEAAQRGLTKRFLLAGYLDDPARVVARSNVLALSSRYEGFPNVVLEALATGVPVAAFRCPGGVTEILVEGETGFYAEAGDAESLASAVVKTAERGFAPSALKRYAEDSFDGSVVVGKFASLFREVLRG